MWNQQLSAGRPVARSQSNQAQRDIANLDTLDQEVKRRHADHHRPGRYLPARETKLIHFPGVGKRSRKSGGRGKRRIVLPLVYAAL